MTRPVAGGIVALIGLLVLLFAGAAIGGTLALIFGIVLIVAGVAIAVTGWPRGPAV